MSDSDMVTIQVSKEEVARKWALDNGFYFITFEAADVIVKLSRDAFVFNAVKYSYHLTPTGFDLHVKGDK